MTGLGGPTPWPEVPDLCHDTAGVEDAGVGVEVGEKVDEHHRQLLQVETLEQGGGVLVPETTQFSLSSILRKITS